MLFCFASKRRHSPSQVWTGSTSKNGPSVCPNKSKFDVARASTHSASVETVRRPRPSVLLTAAMGRRGLTPAGGCPVQLVHLRATCGRANSHSTTARLEAKGTLSRPELPLARWLFSFCRSDASALRADCRLGGRTLAVLAVKSSHASELSCERQKSIFPAAIASAPTTNVQRDRSSLDGNG